MTLYRGANDIDTKRLIKASNIENTSVFITLNQIVNDNNFDRIFLITINPLFDYGNEDEHLQLKVIIAIMLLQYCPFSH